MVLGTIGWEMIVVEHESAVCGGGRDSLAVICIGERVSDTFSCVRHAGARYDLLFSGGVVIMVLVKIVN